MFGLKALLGTKKRFFRFDSEVKYFQKGFEIDKVDTLLHRSKLSFRISTQNLGEQIQKDFAILR